MNVSVSSVTGKGVSFVAPKGSLAFYLNRDPPWCFVCTSMAHPNKVQSEFLKTTDFWKGDVPASRQVEWESEKPFLGALCGEDRPCASDLLLRPTEEMGS